MTSIERHELRYQRQKAKRAEKAQLSNQFYDNFDNVFTFDNLWKSYRSCIKGVAFKGSTQRIRAHPLTVISQLYQELHNGTYKSKGFYEFDLCERGKCRHIKSVHITERIVQKCLCEYCLLPIFRKYLIHDNGACLKNKGIDFTLNRLKRHLKQYYRNYQNAGYVLLIDYKGYYDNISHKCSLKILGLNYLANNEQGDIKQWQYIHIQQRHYNLN